MESVVLFSVPFLPSWARLVCREWRIEHDYRRSYLQTSNFPLFSRILQFVSRRCKQLRHFVFSAPRYHDVSQQDIRCLMEKFPRSLQVLEIADMSRLSFDLLAACSFLQLKSLCLRNTPKAPGFEEFFLFCRSQSSSLQQLEISILPSGPCCSEFCMHRAIACLHSLQFLTVSCDLITTCFHLAGLAQLTALRKISLSQTKGDPTLWVSLFSQWPLLTSIRWSMSAVSFAGVRPLPSLTSLELLNCCAPRGTAAVSAFSDLVRLSVSKLSLVGNVFDDALCSAANSMSNLQSLTLSSSSITTNLFRTLVPSITSLDLFSSHILCKDTDFSLLRCLPSLTLLRCPRDFLPSVNPTQIMDHFASRPWIAEQLGVLTSLVTLTLPPLPSADSDLVSLLRLPFLCHVYFSANFLGTHLSSTARTALQEAAGPLEISLHFPSNNLEMHMISRTQGDSR
eukprot:GILJ01009310.1.p1 GENE.GILJ01009310.1~~GILJ01009310.1.p1  ORF type:complete len:453 (+),score=38.30 GILJ01009310.1:40-1398(+)